MPEQGRWEERRLAQQMQSVPVVAAVQPYSSFVIRHHQRTNTDDLWCTIERGLCLIQLMLQQHSLSSA